MLKLHPDAEAKMLSRIKLVRYQDNPANWGPQSKAVSGRGQKRKMDVTGTTSGAVTELSEPAKDDEDIV